MGSEYIITPSGSFISTDELYHHGIKGMKWGVRKKSYYDSSGSKNTSIKQTDWKARREKFKKSVKIGAAVVGASLAVYGGYKLSHYTKNKNASTKIVKKALEQLTDATKTASLVDKGKDAMKTAITNIPKSTVSQTPINATNISRATVNRTPINAANISRATVDRTTINAANTRANYDYESLMKANSDLLKRSMDDLLKGL